MNDKTTASVRLIDANALEKIMKDIRDCDDSFGSPSEVATWNRAIKELETAPTVETIDETGITAAITIDGKTAVFDSHCGLLCKNATVYNMAIWNRLLSDGEKMEFINKAPINIK